ncbi:MAG: LPP20 family lipoprotein [Fibrobacteres bacterium]|nr:LPP20 family lipoprotein [Fibrobacterota bacterium]
MMLKIVVVFVLSVRFLLYASNSKPDWLITTPNNPQYYTGIGVSEKKDKDYRESAKLAALNDIASQITVNLSSDFVHKISEGGGVVEDEVRSVIRSNTKSRLEGYEEVDSWETDKQYWIYYRLSKAKHEQLKQERLAKTASQALSLLNESRSLEVTGDYAGAYHSYLQALNSLQDVIGEPLKVFNNGDSVFLMNDIVGSFQKLLNKITLIPVKPLLNGKVGLPLKEQVAFAATYSDGKTQPAKPVSRIPVFIAFQKGKGDVTAFVECDTSGVARTAVTKISSAEKMQTIGAVVDLSRSVFDTASVLYKWVCKNLVVPKTSVQISVSALTVALESNEMLFDKALDVKYIEPAIKKALADSNISFIAAKEKPDCLVSISAKARKGSTLQDLYVAFVDLNLSITNPETGEELYKTGLKNLKGIQLDYDRAALKAYEAAAAALVKSTPEIVSKIRR